MQTPNRAIAGPVDYPEFWVAEEARRIADRLASQSRQRA